MLAKLLAVSSLIGLAGLLAWSYFDGGIVASLASPELSAAEKIHRLQAVFRSLGPAAPLAYVAFVTIEVVVAPIPGAMLYAPGGIIFGGFWGGLLSLSGNVLGAGIACQLIRVLGRSYVESYFERSKVKDYEQQLTRNGVWIVLLLRINPLTSSDLVSYAAGLTSVPVWKVMLGTLLGMAPLCWTQAYLADSLMTSFPRLIYPLLIGCLIYTGCVFWVLRRLVRPAS